MDKWEHGVGCMSTREIAKAVRNDAWQDFRVSLKGLSTRSKLDRLDAYRTRKMADSKDGKLSRDDQVRIDNYINALLRGGQLVHKDGEIVVQR